MVNNPKPLTTIFLMGFASGLPFLLILSTLSVWLAEIGISKTMIGLFAWVSIPYSLKFLWGPLVDNVQIPLLTKTLGLRRSWIVVAQLFLWLSLIALSLTNPLINLWSTAICALLVGFSSAIQDIAIEAYRIEILDRSKIGVGASASVLGYRVGMLCSGAGTIFLASYFNHWGLAYNCTAACMLIGILTTLSCSEPTVHVSAIKMNASSALKSFLRQHDWRIIIAFILSYKVADTVLNTMSMPFLLEIGFTTTEIASVAKTFGIVAMVIGGIIGGLLLKKQSLARNLTLCVILQAIASILFMLQASLGANLSFLFVSMGLETFACGMCQVALIAYMSQLCAYSRSTAMQYAILSSFASLVRVCFSVVSGWLADHLAWPQFYAIVAVSCVPSLILLSIFARHFMHPTHQDTIVPQPSSVNGEIEYGN